MSTQLDPLTISADLLYSVKTDGDSVALREELAALERRRLERALGSREGRLAFWLNCYNAYVQILLEEHPSLLEGGLLDRWRFFAGDRVPVAGIWLSLDTIEHGLLRGSKHPWGMGYLPDPFPSSFERKFRLEDVDPRIHFALSSGSEHAPPVTVYTPADVDSELEIATEWFLEENVRYDRGRDVLEVPRLFLWYRGDFGGKRGILAFLERYDVVPPAATPTLTYSEYEWPADLETLRR
ncbi:DUF547 domain-containing protein [Halobacteria archaeon AArc-curdl1]|uniref:DUF547 domain-containing protein n=1 Tax=Natronosalvus hydrolyticus TaxID=2979988 RepID=A0AAP2Z9B0_9EURY|nr:DUF547 domain-containing protein [Halobacteria archaeon AArc-curdl1]